MNEINDELDPMMHPGALRDDPWGASMIKPFLAAFQRARGILVSQANYNLLQPLQSSFEDAKAQTSELSRHHARAKRVNFKREQDSRFGLVPFDTQIRVDSRLSMQSSC